jgi:hypothetical protein
LRKENISHWKFFLFCCANPDIKTTNEMICNFVKIKEFTNGKGQGENPVYLKLIKGEKLANEHLKNKSERVKGNKNPAFDHGGRLSPFSEKFFKGDIRKETLEKSSLTRKENPHKQTTNRLYFFEEAQCSYDLADYLLKERQAVGRLERFIERYGEEEGKKRWQDRQEKWLKSNKKINFSKISQDLFWDITNEIGTEGVQFAQLKECVAYFDGSNKEKTIKTAKSYIKADFIF